MKITGEYSLAADRETVWSALNDPDVLERCIPGCESLDKAGDDELQAKVKAAVGPVRATFDTRLTLENLHPPESYKLVGESKAGAAGFGRGSADVTLTEQAGGTLLRYEAQFQVGGKLAQVGSRLVVGATRKTADEFFDRFSRQVDPQAQRIEMEEIEIEEEEGIEAAETAMLMSRFGTVIAVIAVVLVLLAIWFLLG